MQVIVACHTRLPPTPYQMSPNGAQQSLLGRRELCFDSLSSVCSDHPSPSDVVSSVVPSPPTSPRYDEAQSNKPGRVVRKSTPLMTRRMLFANVFMFSSYHPSSYLQGNDFHLLGGPLVCASTCMSDLLYVYADGVHLPDGSITSYALGDPSVTVEQVTPPTFPSAELLPSEERVVKLFEKNTYSVVNIFDVTLRPQLNITGAVEIPEGNGSGVVWDGQGHIVTNYHVIGSSLSKNPSRGQVVARVNILASEGLQKNFEGKLVGADRAKDLAVLKVEAYEELLKPIKVGPSSSLRVGQQCLAIGNPFGFDHTLTVGVISGLNREIFSQTGVTIGGGIQTDAAINPGNSGGPLLDSKGNLIGINTAIFTQTGTSAGVGFAIPSSTVAKIVPQLIQFGKVVRAGINVDIAPDLIANQLNVRNGALVLQVPNNSLAAKSGILPTTRGFAGNIALGDIIVAVNGKPVKNKAELYKVLDDYNVGDKVLLTIQRGSENLELPIALEEKDS